ncbi:MAG: VWA domain-containing protein [Actinomycetota bacterium]
MNRRRLSLLLAFVLLVTACDDDTSADIADSGSPGDDAAPSDDAADDGDDGGGWLGGEPADAPTSDVSDGSADDGEMADDDMADESLAAADVAMPEEVFLEPPIDEPLPPDDSPLQAGSIDDAADVARYLEYRSRITQLGISVRPLDISDSTVFTVIGANGLPVLDAEVQIWDADDQIDRSVAEPLRTLHARADGSVRLLPSTIDPMPADLEVTVRVGETVTPVSGFTVGTPAVVVNVGSDGGYRGSVPLDIVFVIDATGSMGDEIGRLRDNMTSVARQIDALPSQPDVRFGMTVYRDIGDDYLTNTFDLTGSLDDFLAALDQVEAEGGGDYPEAMDEALGDAMQLPDWRRQNAVQLMFLLADAPPQVQREVNVPYTATAVAAAESGVKIFPIAASGTDDQAEYVMRELAFVTGGRYVFLSYGVGGAATGGSSDITTQDYDELPRDQLVVRLVQDELAALTGVEPGQGQAPPTTTVPVTTTTQQ